MTSSPSSSSLFARYESRLEELGLFTSANGRVDVNWDKFARDSVGPNFMTELGTVSAAAEYILNSPPMKQVADGRVNRPGNRGGQLV